MLPSQMTKRLGRGFGKSDGNVSMFFALSLPVLALAVAIGIDYTNATIVKSKLNSAADAAALAALTPAMLQQSDSTAQAAAYAMFDARAAAISSLVASQTSRKVKITHPTNNTSIRLVEVDYSVQSSTIFSGILHTSSMGIGGSSTAQASVPPNIDFYLLLDNSPSMALPATQDGLTAMQKLTPTQDGGNSCAFACHQASTNNTDTMGNLCTDKTAPQFPQCNSDGTVNLTKQYCSPDPSCSSSVANQYSNYTPKTQMDNFAMSRNSGITLRLDELSAGVTTLMNTAYKYQTSGIWAAPPTYRFADYSMDSLWSIGVTNTRLMALTTDYVNQWSAASSGFGVMEMWANNYTCADAACDGKGSQGDVATAFDNALHDINNTMPTPGNGTNQSGDKPQEVVFFVTDGVEDEATNQCSESQTPTVSGRCQAPLDPSLCSAIKNRGIKIAILYTEYLQVPANWWYSTYISPFQPSISANLQACASTGLFYDAAIGANLGDALTDLFQKVVQSAAFSN